jgi:hypothetical protein
MHPATGGNPVLAQSASLGVVKFTLDSGSYKWEFIPTAAGGFTDSGTATCN